MKKNFCFLFAIISSGLYSQQIIFDFSEPEIQELDFDHEILTQPFGALDLPEGRGIYWATGPSGILVFEDNVYISDTINKKIIKYNETMNTYSEIEVDDAIRRFYGVIDNKYILASGEYEYGSSYFFNLLIFDLDFNLVDQIVDDFHWPSSFLRSNDWIEFIFTHDEDPFFLLLTTERIDSGRIRNTGGIAYSMESSISWPSLPYFSDWRPIMELLNSDSDWLRSRSLYSQTNYYDWKAHYDFRYYTFLGNDLENQYYYGSAWRGEYYIIIVSNNGAFVDAFSIPWRISRDNTYVTDVGDILFFLPNIIRDLSVDTYINEYSPEKSSFEIARVNRFWNIVETTGEVRVNSLRVRELPNIQSEILGLVNTGDIVSIQSISNFTVLDSGLKSYWYRIRNDQISGWAFGHYIDIDY